MYFSGDVIVLTFGIGFLFAIVLLGGLRSGHNLVIIISLLQHVRVRWSLN